MTNVKCQMNECLRHIIYKIIIPSFLIFNLSFVICPVSAQEVPKPLWSQFGVVVNDTIGNTPQQNPKFVSNGENGYIVIWEDGRSGYYDVYAQKIDESGKLLWKKEGVPACKYFGNQNFAEAVTDGYGGAIIVWQDYRSGTADIYAQRINYAGTPLWGKGGRPICQAPAGQFAPQLTSDGAGGAIITWHDYRGKAGEDIYAQRIDAKGKVLWLKDGIPISTAKITQWYPKITSDGAGGAIITWADGRNGAANKDIYAQRISHAGKPYWEKDGIPICSAAHNQAQPVISPTSQGAIIAWSDFRSKNSDIYAQKIDLNGNLRWAKDGVAVCTFPYAQEDPKLSTDGSNGIIIVWTDQRSEGSNIYAQRIYQDGKIAWAENGRPVCLAPGTQKKPAIAKLKTEDWLIVWEDQRTGKTVTDLYAQKLNSAGTPLLKTNGVPIASAREMQEHPSIITTKTGNVLIVWQDNRNGNFDLYSQKVSPDGVALWKKTGKIVCNATGSVVQQNVALIHNGKGEIILVFEDARSGYFNVYAQLIKKSGALAWGKHGIPVAKVAANQVNPRLVPDGKGGAIIAWEDHRLKEFPEIRVQRINRKGKKVWESSIPAAKVKARQTNPLMVSDKKGGAIIAWQDNRHVLNLVDLYAQRISPAGKLLWGAKGKALVAENGEQIDADMISDGKGGAFLTWTDYRRGDRNPDIFAQRINAKGQVVWKKEAVQACGAPDVQRSAKVIWDGQGGIIVSWTDKGGGSYDIYAQRIDKNGRILWMKDGIPVNQLSRTQQNADFGNKKILVWEDYRYGNWDIFAQAVSPAGKLLWKKDGIPVVMTSHTQNAPTIIPWKRGSILIAWEDYRSGKHYEIYLQKLDINGKTTFAKNGVKNKSRDGGRSPKIVATPSDNSFYVFWEDYTNGGRAIYGQRYLLY